MSWSGRLSVLVAIFLTFYLCLFLIYPFLAITHRVNASVLVVEGWIHEYAIRAASNEFQNNHYERIFTTGDPLREMGDTLMITKLQPVSGQILKKYGLTNESVQMVPSRVMDRDRTYGSAVALRNWFRDHNMSVSGIDVVTELLHARRTQLLYQKVFGRHVPVGIIAVPNPDYNPKHWWHYSDGVREVLGEKYCLPLRQISFLSAGSATR